jgi:hypothetical protein
MDEAPFLGGATLYSVDGDDSGNMIVAMMGCTSYNTTATGTDAYGRPTTGAAVGCTYHLKKLAAADGAEVWDLEMPKSFGPCRTIMDGSTFCKVMSVADETLDFGNSVTMTGTASTVAVVKISSAGVAEWAAPTIAATYSGDLSVNSDGTLLAVIGSSGGGYGPSPPALVARVDTSSGSEGTVLWQDAGGVGTHGFRGVEVTADPLSPLQEVVTFGQVTGTETLTDVNGATTTLRSRGSYEVFVAAYDSATGVGKYAMDGGGTGMEYFFAFARDAGTNDVYIGGTSRSEIISWGNVERHNEMYNGDPGENNPDTSSAVGSSKAFTVKLKSQMELPHCLSTCDPTGDVQASDVKAGYCYIDRYCYEHEAMAPYDGHECMQCDATASPLAWSGPVGIGSTHCMISNTCVAAGTHRQVQVGYSSVDSVCQSCQPSVSSDDYSLIEGYNFNTFTETCEPKTWQVEAVRNGWTAPSPSCTAPERRKLTLAQRNNPLRGTNSP